MGDAGGGAPAGLPVFVIGGEAVGDVVICAHVHRFAVGGPEPGGEFAGGGGGVVDFDGGGVFLPEILDAHGDAAGAIGEDAEAHGAGAVGDVEPRTGRGGAFVDGEAVGAELGEFHVVVDGDGFDGGAVGHLVEVGLALAGEVLFILRPGGVRRDSRG